MNDNGAKRVLVTALAGVVAVAVLTLGDFKGVKSIIQAGVAGAAVWCVWRYPVAAVVVYLVAYYLPNNLLGGSAPLPYPFIVLPIALSAALFLPAQSGAVARQGGGTAWTLLLVLCILTAASSWWGNEPLSETLVLGFAFALGSRAILRRQRDWWFALGVLTAAELAFALWTYETARELTSEATVGHFSRAGDISDVNYTSFHVGLAALAGWSVALCGWRLARSTPWLKFVVCGSAAAAFLAGLWLIVQFQSRGISAAVAAGLVASLAHCRMRLKTVVLGGLFLGSLLVSLSQGPAFESLVERWKDSEEIATGASRYTLWQWSLRQWKESSLVTKVFGFGFGTELKGASFDTGLARASQISTHNSFVRFFMDQGLMGATLFTALLAFCAYKAWKRKDGMGNLRFTLLLYLIVACLSIEPHVVVAFWLVLALSMPFQFLQDKDSLSRGIVLQPGREIQDLTPYCWLRRAGLLSFPRVKHAASRRLPAARFLWIRSRWRFTART